MAEVCHKGQHNECQKAIRRSYFRNQFSVLFCYWYYLNCPDEVNPKHLSLQTDESGAKDNLPRLLASGLG